MKPQNNEFLNNLLSKYSEFEGILHGSKESGSTKRKTKMQGVEHGAAPEMVAYEVREKALSILAEISSIVSSRSEGKKYQGKEGEERMTRVLSRFLTQNPQAQEVYREELGIMGKKKIMKTVPTMDDLLDEIGVSVGEILSESQSLIPDIYRTSSKNEDDGIIRGSGNGLDEVRVAPKYEILMQVLSVLGVDPRNVSVTTEKMDPKRMRKYPYKIVHILGVPHPITFTVSDEIGQSTYIYGGYVDLSQFIEAKKGSILSGIRPEEVIYGEKYRERLENIVGGILRGEKTIKNIKTIIGEGENEKNDQRIEQGETTTLDLTPEILRYQAMLLGVKEGLREAGIFEKEINGKMVWYFDDARENKKWPKVNDKNLASFPSGTFNKEKGIGDKRGVIYSSQELAKMFEALGLRVATNEECILLQKEKHERQIPIWRKELLNERKALKEVGIMEKKIGDDMIWCFDEASKWRSIKINGKALKSFPSCAFNREKSIGDEEGVIEAISELAKMFESLGLGVATEEEYMILQEEKYKKQIPIWREEILRARVALREAGIMEKKIGDDMIWCFDEASKLKFVKINGKALISFPSATFNKKKGIGDKRGTIEAISELAKMFEALELRVATEEEYSILKQEEELKQIPIWKKELLSHREKLRGVGIFEREIHGEMVWCFDGVQGCKKWPEINERHLTSFPSTTFNKEKGIGNKSGAITNPQELAKMFEVLGLRVKHPEKKKKTD